MVLKEGYHVPLVLCEDDLCHEFERLKVFGDLGYIELFVEFLHGLIVEGFLPHLEGTHFPTATEVLLDHTSKLVLYPITHLPSLFKLIRDFFQNRLFHIFFTHLTVSSTFISVINRDDFFD